MAGCGGRGTSVATNQRLRNLSNVPRLKLVSLTKQGKENASLPIVPEA